MHRLLLGGVPGGRGGSIGCGDGFSVYRVDADGQS
jgi:hypothetical protein